MSAQSLLHSVFSCSSPASGGAASAKGFSKRKLRQTRSLDPALIGGCGGEAGVEGSSRGATAGRLCSPLPAAEGLGPRSASSPRGPHPRANRLPPPRPLCSSFSTPSTPLEKSPSGSFHFDYEVPLGRSGLKKSMAWDLPSVLAGPGSGRSAILCSSGGGPNGIFTSPRRWLQQRKFQSPPNSHSHPYVVWKSEGDFTWNSMSGRSVRLRSVPIQSLSELERARLQEVAFYQLQQDCDLSCPITIPKDGQKRKKSLRKKLDSLGKEKNKDREFIPQAFGMPLSQVIANDRAYKLKQDSQRDEQKDASDFVASLLPFGNKRQNKELSSSNSSLSSTSETPNESTSPNTPEPAPRARRRGAMSVDSITDLDDNQSRLLEALQLSLPAEAQSKKEKARDKKLSLNPIYRQVPRLVDSCCQHLEKHGLQTVGIFRVGSSKKRVRQLREEFDRGVDVSLEEEHSVHDVAALLKEFLRDMPDPLLTRELYTAFINTLLLEPEEQLGTLQLLIYLLPPCNCDTLHRLLQFLSMVARHANDNVSKDGQEVTGNKMTSLNLATIFGPNLLHKQKSSDKEFTVQSSARAEESTAIIAVVQKMIENYEALFMVPPDLQNEVLISLLETDPDVVDYLLRRKASQSSSPDMLRSEVSFSVGGRHSSTDSNKASSGDLSPYDNNSPVLSERSLLAMQEDVAPGGSEKLYKGPEQYVLVSHLPSSKSRESSPGPRLGKGMSEEPFNIWGTWHSTLKSGSKDPGMTGSYGDIFESSSLRPGPCSLSQGNLSPNWPRWQGSPPELESGTQAIRRTQTTATVGGCGACPPGSRVCSTPHIRGGRRSEQAAPKAEQYLTLSSAEDLTESELDVAWLQSRAKPSHQRPLESEKHDKRPPPPYPGPGKPALASSHQPAEPLLWRPQRPEEGSRTALEEGSQTAEREHQAAEQKLSSAYSSSASDQNSKTLGEPNWLDWQRERWQIWELLSTDNPDALPETLV
ncbi:rho GTPase-activating protein 6 isoform X1 [Canis lupus familiaris]|uniref:rho GTPase-activating protein 6 isoform X1 n=1 Tax=Canis lupus dingo TaxID=286419 RepID=UPI00005A5CD2|nr:rho GTPase-activating protein 6 isoform X1 [Canis lupus dingo]XP_548858.2 rho GTPase-activating protein 6 isoform X1 [Canis lupus familiaris]|eukprot:XP_548858.2 rho GTPase-activating protein 6 isoform X1 [Canis lupus familiaris]